MPPIMSVAFRSCCFPNPYESLEVTVEISSTPCVRSLPLVRRHVLRGLENKAGVGFAPLQNHLEFLVSVQFTEFHFSP